MTNRDQHYYLTLRPGGRNTTTQHIKSGQPPTNYDYPNLLPDPQLCPVTRPEAAASSTRCLGANACTAPLLLPARPCSSCSPNQLFSHAGARPHPAYMPCSTPPEPIPDPQTDHHHACPISIPLTPCAAALGPPIRRSIPKSAYGKYAIGMVMRPMMLVSAPGGDREHIKYVSV